MVLDQIYDDSKVKPHQYEFARLNLNYTEQAKTVAISRNIVNGWDDPRMPTIWFT
jgi:glutaminyl-tRNA synthetase